MRLALEQKEKAILETRGMPITPQKFGGNHGQSIAIWGDPIRNPNRG